MKPPVSLLDSSFVYIAAATHTTSEAFAKRQRERFLIARNVVEPKLPTDNKVRDLRQVKTK